MKASSTTIFACITGGIARRWTQMSMKSTLPPPSNLWAHFDRLRSNKKEVLLLDGGTGEELFRQGVPDDRKIWSATAVVNPKYHSILKKVHQSFADAGSDAITTNSYGIVPGVGFTLPEIAQHVACAGRIARESVIDKPVLGSLGPLVESYRPDRFLPHDQGVDTYTTMAKALAPNVDCFLVETMSSYEECTQAIEAVAGLPPSDVRPIMVSFTLDRDGNFRNGASAQDELQRVLKFQRQTNAELLAILFNCSEPEAISLALERIQKSNLPPLLAKSGIILGAYANRLTPIASDWTLENSDAAQSMRDDLGPQEYFTFVSRWLDLNAQIVGGCCGITPEHISYLRVNI